MQPATLISQDHEVAVSSTVIVAGSYSTTAAIASNTVALRSAATTLTAFMVVIGYLGMAYGSGFTVPITTPMAATATGFASKRSRPAALIGGRGTTLAWDITNSRCSD
jgi:hypothetical protein